jgi:hypothetical protein
MMQPAHGRMGAMLPPDRLERSATGVDTGGSGASVFWGPASVPSEARTEAATLVTLLASREPDSGQWQHLLELARKDVYPEVKRAVEEASAMVAQ